MTRSTEESQQRKLHLCVGLTLSLTRATGLPSRREKYPWFPQTLEDVYAFCAGREDIIHLEKDNL